MGTELTAREKRFIRDLKDPGKSRRNTIQLISYLIFLVGGIIIVAVCFYLLGNLTDKAVYTVGVPGIIAGLIITMFGYFLILLDRRRHREFPRP